ncbi:hypothetical protein N7517_008134 [Penicillium concentricum]|uniref:Uncharacterized protein n=1 Tax=Penicillium concentricum TaxID=293559 RepID=A0A9W9RWR7_9EURO|nr:uncharacterized protein N7517_008134 [Penicillium concentricum]KAJ5365248.1 hypothetical protein N7517_008134 [Penicillium concentricum]
MPQTFVLKLFHLLTGNAKGADESAPRSLLQLVMASSPDLSLPPSRSSLLPSLRNMAPRLPRAKLKMIQDMISSKSLTTSEMANAAECSKRSIINISNNLRWFGNVKAPQTRVGRRRTFTPSMLEALSKIKTIG